jgi:hypothetical protein
MVIIDIHPQSPDSLGQPDLDQKATSLDLGGSTQRLLAPELP